jgi:hypothetical protein
MSPRAYASSLAAAATACFLAVVAANVIIDPQGVFGTGILPRSANANTRYLSFAEYRAAPDRYDGIMFGSSRAGFPLEELSRRMDGARFLGFAVSLGTLADHLPMLEFVLRDKVSRGRRLRAVFLLLDVDLLLDEQRFGAHPVTGRLIYRLMPPALTGENPARFWWMNLTAIQVSTWYSAIREAWTRSHPGQTPKASRGGSWDALGSAVMALAGPASASAQPLSEPPPPTAETAHVGRAVDRADFQAYLELLKQFVLLCPQHGTKLLIATSPLHPAVQATINPVERASAVDQISRIAPLWDFSRPHPALSRPELWNDLVHFRTEIAQMMISRIFGDQLPPEWEGFGRHLAGNVAPEK